MADTDAYADIFVAEMRGQRSEAVMTGAATSCLHPHLAGDKIELVVEDDHVRRIELVEARGLAGGLEELGYLRREDKTSTVRGLRDSVRYFLALLRFRRRLQAEAP